MHKKKRRTINRRVGIVAGIEGGLAQLGFFPHQVQRVVKRWPRVPVWMIHKYFFTIAQAARWNTNELELRVYSRAHWPLVWELAAACEQIRNIPKTDPVHWLLKLPLNVWSRSILPDGKPDKTDISWAEIPWREISQQIRKRGGPGCKFSPVRLRQAAKRLRLVAAPELTKGFLESPLAPLAVA